MKRRLERMLAASVLLAGAMSVPVALSASAAEMDLDDGGGIVVGVDIAPRPGCAESCGPAPSPSAPPPPPPPTAPPAGWRLADSGADVSPTLLVALAFGATGVAVVAVGRSRARDVRSSDSSG